VAGSATREAYSVCHSVSSRHCAVAAENLEKEIYVAESDVGTGLGQTSSLSEINLVNVRLHTTQQLTTVVVMATGGFSL
jgi:hypothetical protein